jgi:hypothetical protein
MNAENNHEPDLSDLPQADVQSKKQISIVWLIPIVAVLIGGWLAYKGLSEKGPMVTITFESAEGLEAGKTQVKYKDVKLGEVQSIRFNADLSRVIMASPGWGLFFRALLSVWTREKRVRRREDLKDSRSLRLSPRGCQAANFC